ncbi:MAG TPA: hypothetical protein VLP43_00400 [Solirubrobacteraceae bacterium]|nr:hypothetical protein [Solirubrobacteraceae bacterium]
MSSLIAAASPPAAGAPLDQVIGATAAGLLLAAALLVIGLRYREDRFPLLDTIARPFTWLLRVPAWAALPVALATGSLVLAGTGFYWDVAVHIDRGRDPGPFGTPAHFPILIGLFGIFASGWLAIVMARGREAGHTGIKLTETWVVPTSGLVMMACGGFALLGFPLDDLWHATFGQDVTLWGPTHLIMLTGGQLMIPTILGLLLEGRAATGKPADTGVAARDGAEARWGARAIALSGAGGVLAGLTIYQDEFANGVPQYNLLFQPALLAFTAALALVFGRAVCGRGGALGAAAFNLVVSGLFTVVVGPVLGEVLPHFSTYLAAALAVEVAALIVSPCCSLAGFTALAALLVATLGTLGEWGFSHLWMPIPWPGHFVPSAIAIAVPAALAGGLIGAFVAGALAPTRIGRIGATRWGAGAVGAVGFAAVIAFCLPTHAPAGATATVTLDHPGARSQATVAFHPGSVVSEPDYLQQLSWQGHAKSVVAILRRIAPGVYRTTQPLPIAGSWKSLIRIGQGRMRADVPVYMPADPAIPAALIPAGRTVTRPLVTDHLLMQRERKRGVAGWLWGTATATVLAIIAVLLAIIGWGLDRVAGRVSGEPPVAGRRVTLRRRRVVPAPAGVGK